MRKGIKKVLLWTTLFLWAWFLFITSFVGVGYILHSLLGWKVLTGILTINIPIYVIVFLVFGLVLSEES